jgi:hypothetical protein
MDEAVASASNPTSLCEKNQALPAINVVLLNLPKRKHVAIYTPKPILWSP